MIKTRINPATGKAETYDDYAADLAQAKLQRTRRELRDMLEGNVQFHDDPRAAPEKPAEPDEIQGDCSISSTAPLKVGDLVRHASLQGVGGVVLEILTLPDRIRIRRHPTMADPLGQTVEDYDPDYLSKMPVAFSSSQFGRLPGASVAEVNAAWRVLLENAAMASAPPRVGAVDAVVSARLRSMAAWAAT